MTVATADIAVTDAQAKPARPVHPLWVRIAHWINAAAVLLLIGSGWEVYNASPLFRFVFPKAITLGEWLGGGLLWHFAAMWVFVLNGLVYVGLGLATGRFRRKLMPLRARDVLRDARSALTGRLSHADPAVYNAVQKLLYAGVLLAGAVIVLSGLSIWKPVQVKDLTSFFGGYDAARYVHFFAMAAIAAFVTLHVAMALLLPKRLRTMVLGR